MEVVKENNKTVLNVISEKLNTLKKKLKQPKGTQTVISIDKIYVPKQMAKSLPKLDKYKKYENYFLEHKKVDKPIEVFKDKYNKDKYILNNQYIRYLILKEHGITEIPIKIVKNTR